MEWYRSKRKRGHMAEIAVIVLIAAVAVAVGMKIFGIGPFYQPDVSVPSWVTQEFLTPNEYSRPQTPLGKVKNIVIHYVANPGTSAENNRNYFENLKDTHTTKASSHFIVGLEGEVIQCIPLDEYSYASNDRNYDTVSIEVCHPDDTGKFTDATYRSLVQLTAWLCVKFGLTEDDVIRHYDVTGKNCPKYFVEHEDAWEDFKENVSLAITSEN